MPFPSDPDLLVLLGLRLASFGPAEAVAEAAGLTPPEVDSRLAALGDEGLAAFRDGRRSGWMLTPEGRAAGERRLAAELDAAGARGAVMAAYGRFLGVNQACSIPAPPGSCVRSTVPGAQRPHRPGPRRRGGRQAGRPRRHGAAGVRRPGRRPRPLRRLRAPPVRGA